MEDVMSIVKSVFSGSTACKGCGASIGLKIALQTLNNVILVNSTGCMTLTGKYLKVPFIHGGFNAVSVSKGLVHANKDANILVYAGDGATRTCLQSLLSTKENILYICYNNSGFCNFGYNKNDESIAKLMVFNASYVATASISYPDDYIKKIKKAQTINGFKFIEILTPCPISWGFDPSYTIEIGRLAVETAIWPLYEIEDGILNLTKRPTRLEPVERYIELQKRFSLSTEQIQTIQETVNKKWKSLLDGKIK
ncbi:MAG: pyruvate synthase subunit beta [Candidatus Aenigmatarchaeota archaeon]